MTKSKYYTLDRIQSRGAHYNVIFGERSNGKTYAVLRYGLERYFEDGSVLGIIRRWDTDFTGATSMKTCYASLEHNGEGENEISELSHGYYTCIEYYAGKYYLAYDDGDGKIIRSDKVVAYAFALNVAEHSKSASFPTIKTILFDEFMTRSGYLNDEFILFQNTVSTIVRRRDDVKIFMCANTVNKFGCPYFTEMGLKHIKNMVQGDIEVYEYEDTPLKVAVEFSDSPAKKKPSDVYFSFKNPRLGMITGTGCVWEIPSYPHCPVKYRPADIVFVFILIYDDEVLQADVVSVDSSTFIFFHRKTTPIKDDDNDLIYTTSYSEKPNYRRNIFNRKYEVENKIAELFRLQKVFYADNEVGEIVHNYLDWCRKNK